MRIYIIVFFSLIPLIGRSQIDSSEVNNSPYGAIYNHLYYLQNDSYDPGRAALSFPQALDDSEELAIQLKGVLDGKGYYVDINRLPKNQNYRDTIRNEDIYIVDAEEPRIYVEKIDGQWRYSRTTVDQIPVLFKEVYPFGTGYARSFHGPFWNYSIVGISVVKWLGLLILLLLGTIIFYVVKFISSKLVGKFLKRKLHTDESMVKEIKRLSRILALFFVIRLFLYFLPMFQVPPKMNALAIKMLGLLSIFFLVLLVTQIANIAFRYLEDVTKKTENTLDEQLLPVLRMIVKILIWSIGLIYILEYLDVNITALLAGISIGGLAIALAAQDTVKNFFGSIMIFMDRPFKIGDWINFDDVDGTVEEVGFRSTRIRTFANSVVYVPNGMLADAVVNNMGLRQFRRFKTELGVTYNTPPQAIDLFVKGIREIIKRHPTTRKDYYEVHLNSFASSSIDILLYCFFEATDWTAELKSRHEIIYAILLLADELGVSFAFPSQSLYVESYPSKENRLKEIKSDKDLDSSISKIDAYFNRKKADDRGDKINPIGGE